MTLTREQIEETWALLCEKWPADQHMNYHKGFRNVFDLALNSIPRPFDPEDETTWPGDGDHLVELNGGVAFAVVCFEGGKWYRKGADYTNSVSKWQPITPPKEEHQEGEG